MSMQAKTRRANVFSCAFLTFSALCSTRGLPNSRKGDSRSETFFQDRKNRRKGSGQRQNNARNADTPLLHDLLHNRSYRKKNGVFCTKF